MASVIRVNTINSRSGLSTVTFDNSGAGVEVAGIITATTFSGALTGTTGTFSGDVSIVDKIVHTGDTNTAIRFPASDTFTVETAGTERFRINSSGLVGIGTASPVKKLEVWDATQGVIRIRGGGGGSDSSRKADLSLFASGAREYVVRADASDAAFKIIDVSGSNAERLRIKSDGKVLVGSGCTDASTFNVKGSAGFADDGTNAGLIISTDDANGAALSCLTAGGFAGGSYGVMRLNALQHKFTYGNTVRLNIKSDGDIETDGNLKTNNIPGRNKFINGNFHVWQRSTSSTAGGYVAADRWYHNLSGANMTFSRQTHTDPIDGSRYYARLASTSSDDYCGFRQRVEDAASIPEGKVTVSFWARGHVNGNLAVWGTIHYGSGGSADVDIAEQRTPYLQNDSTFRKYSLTFTIPSHSGKTFGANNYFEMAFGQGTGDSASAWTLDISNIQLEIGSIATAFEQRTFAEELRLCQRYYLVYSRWMGGSRASSTTRSFTVPTPTPMRLCGNPSTGAMTNAASSNGDVGYVGSTRQKGDISVNSITMSTTSGVSAMQANVTSSYAAGSQDGGMVFGLYLPGFTIDHEL